MKEKKEKNSVFSVQDESKMTKRYDVWIFLLWNLFVSASKCDSWCIQSVASSSTFIFEYPFRLRLHHHTAAAAAAATSASTMRTGSGWFDEKGKRVLCETKIDETNK